MDLTRIEQGPGEFSFGEDQGGTETGGKKGHRSGTVGHTPAVLMTVQLHTNALSAAAAAALSGDTIHRLDQQGRSAMTGPAADRWHRDHVAALVVSASLS